MRLWFDADQIDALSADREALWARVGAADFLTVNEKRAAVGYGEVDGGDEVKATEAAGLAGVDLERRYNPNWPSQPRVPAGSGEESGRWTDGGATNGEDAAEAQPAERPILASNDDWLPKIPLDRPPSQSARWIVVKQIVRGLARLSPAGRLLDVIEVGSWVYEYAPYVQAYFDSPKTLAELRDAVATPARGYDIHHLVERTPALKDGYSRDLVDAPENLFRIPTLKHWELNAWYGSKNEFFGGGSPRDYLRGKNWAERRRVGLLGLTEIGVLQP